MQTDSELARSSLVEWGVKPGATIHTILRHCSRSGMMRIIAPVFIIAPDDVRFMYWSVGTLCGFKIDRKREGVKIGGCGMDMGFEMVYQLSRHLYPDGYGCIGEGCPSNDHSNGDRSYLPHNTCKFCLSATEHIVHIKNGIHHWHKDGGYALRQRWL